MATTAPLEGVRVLVTRPVHQADPLCHALASAGAEVCRFPVIAIEAVPRTPELDTALGMLAEQALLVFTSVNAVTMLQRLLEARGLPLPVACPAAAIGGRTARALTEAGFRDVVTAPPPYTSEALLAELAPQRLAGEPAMLVTGEGGRGLIAGELRTRGARLTVLPVYRRTLPDQDPAPLRSRLAADSLDVAIVTSAEGLDNLLALAGEALRSRLLRLALVTVSRRVAGIARCRGFHGAVEVVPAGDAALVQGVVRWRQHQG